MRAGWKITIFCGALVVFAAVGYRILPAHQKTPGYWFDLPGAIQHRLWPNQCPADGADAPLPGQVAPIVMSDATDLLGDTIVTKTFALSVADANGDDRDDILIGAHERNPYLLINSGNGFSDQSSALFSEDRLIDRHGYTFADLDNDGDLDLAVACGGNDGVGPGEPNLFLRNRTENGVVQFTEEAVSPAMAQPPGRSRSFLPIASPDGKAIDLYYATLQRKDFPNKLFVNNRRAAAFEFEPKKSFLSISVDDHGRGVIADFDGDGHNDYLIVEGWKLKIYWHPNSDRGVSRLSYRVFSTTVGDFNNDGRLDIFLGAVSAPTLSDNLTHESTELIYVLTKNGDDDTSSVTFKSESSALEFNLQQHIQATRENPLVDAQDIFLGGQKFHPASRIFALDKQQAAGTPATFAQPGIYIWYSAASQQWNMKWIFHDSLDEFKGSVTGAGISSVTKKNFTTNEPRLVTDAILINQGHGNFAELCTGLPAHSDTTAHATVADFNNDGWLDIIGLRRGEPGSPNGDIFVLTNNAGSAFTASRIGLREQDRLRSADLIAHGFFDADDKPDIILTNGYGQMPGNEGSPRLMLNQSPTAYRALLVNLEGTTANRFGVGARLTLTDADDTVIGFRVQGLNSNISQDTHRVHFGLGDFPAPYQLQVDWPDGVTTHSSYPGPGKYRVGQ